MRPIITTSNVRAGGEIRVCKLVAGSLPFLRFKAIREIRCLPAVAVRAKAGNPWSLQKMQTFPVISRRISCSTSLKTQIREAQNKKGNKQYEKSKPTNI
jgi:hypothetical protein